MTDYARSERAKLADLLVEVGPEAPTLCEGWTAKDLAAHVVVRDRRPDAAAGVVFKPLAGHAERVRRSAAELPYADLVGLVRRPAWWSPAAVEPLDRLVNTQEFFIHHEDLRRGQPGWSPRPLPRDLGEQLWRQLGLLCRLQLRRFPAEVRLVAPGHGERSAGAGGPQVRVAGDPGELVLFLSGRQRASRAEVTGPDEVVDRLRRARLGL